jgi:hypothetical protein
MSPSDRSELFRRVAELRTATFDLLDELAPAAYRHGPDSNVASAAVRLQNVANELGRVERTLRHPTDRAA